MAASHLRMDIDCSDKHGHFSSIEKRVEVVSFPLDSEAKKRHSLYRYLSDDEKQRAARYRFDKHRDRFIIGRGSIREILADLGKCPPQAIRFELNQYGKPTLGEPEYIKHIQFNASSSETMGAIAVSSEMALGIDTEKIKPESRQDYDLIVKNEFHNAEYDWYEKHKVPERIRVFFEFWTCKEAYLKALGIGLSGKLNSFSIDLQGQEPSIRYTELESGTQSEFSLYRLNIADEYVTCLALPEKNIRICLSRW